MNLRQCSVLIGGLFVVACANAAPIVLQIHPEPTVAPSAIGEGSEVFVRIVDHREPRRTSDGGWSPAVVGDYFQHDLFRTRDIVTAGDFSAELRAVISQALRTKGFATVDAAVSHGRELAIEVVAVSWFLGLTDTNAEAVLQPACATADALRLFGAYRGEFHQKPLSLSKIFDVKMLARAHADPGASVAPTVSRAIGEAIGRMLDDEELIKCLASGPRQ